MKIKRAGVAAVLHSVVGRVGLTGLAAFTGVLSARYLHPDGRGELAGVHMAPFLPL